MISTSEQGDLTLKVGDTDSHGETVTRVYARADKKYIIWETRSGALKCGDAGIQLAQHEGINRALIAIGELVSVDPRLGRKYNSLRALGVTYWCRGEVDAATRILDDTHQTLLRVFSRRARLLYISGSLAVVALALLAVAVSAAWATEARIWCLVALFGALGAFVAAALRGHPPTLDVLEDVKATVVYGAIRAAVAIVFALIMYLLVIGGVLFPDLATESTFRLLVLAFVAGFSEKLVPEAVIHQAIGGGAHK